VKFRVFLVILGLFACAQKMVPPSPDRFPPGLEDIQVQNRTKINVIFNEDIDPQSISKDSIMILSSNNETLLLKDVTTGRQNNTITLITEKQQPIRYTLSTEVKDVAENRAKIRGRFMGSMIKDTFPPRITTISPKTGTVKQKRNVRIIIGFSEEVDTVIPINWVVLPKALKSRFNTLWQPDFRQLKFTLNDSLGADTVVYFTFLRSVFDFEGNRLLAPGFTFFTSDTLLNTKLVTGKITDKNKPVGNSFVIFTTTGDSMKSIALTPVDSIGSFAIQVREGIYDVSAVADTNFDDRIDLSGKILGFNTAKETLYVEVYPDSLTHNLDWYLR
jgi:hypothetical protein